MKERTEQEKRVARIGLEIANEYLEGKASRAFLERREDDARRLRDLGDDLLRLAGAPATPTTTRIPDKYADDRDDAQYEGHSLELGGMDTIWSVGRDPLEAITAFLGARTGTTVAVDRTGPRMSPMPHEVGSPFDWGFSFSDTEGSGFKAAGINVPGGVVLTWFK